MLTDRAIVAFLGRYARAHHAGAFATPSLRELAGYTVDEQPGSVVLSRRYARASRRHDWRGEPFLLPANVPIVTHLAREPDAPPPDLSAYEVVRAYPEDEPLRQSLLDAGRIVAAHQITAAGEIVAYYAHRGHLDPPRYTAADAITIARLPDSPDLSGALTELGSLSGWHDDYPFYSDGTWASLSLRGYDPDPTWGVKPSEMGRAWHAEHPGANRRECGWTTLAPACPNLVALTEAVAGGAALERVRVLRMAGVGELGRHTDITDRATGTRDGQVLRLHVPLVTAPSVITRVWDLDGQVHEASLAPGEAWYFDTRKPHAVVNPEGVERLHLAIDVIVNEGVRSRLEEAARCPA